MKGSAPQESGNEGPAHSAAPPLSAFTMKVVDDMPVPLPITDAELQVIERHLRGILDRVLFDEDREDTDRRDARRVLRPRLHRSPG
ncbi:MAG TPA: hypothetical protein VMU06_22355 [Stellaceae bacterium]|nr:hypothetical protein [Stellaceae bacterium]